MSAKNIITQKEKLYINYFLTNMDILVVFSFGIKYEYAVY